MFTFWRFVCVLEQNLVIFSSGIKKQLHNEQSNIEFNITTASVVHILRQAVFDVERVDADYFLLEIIFLSSISTDAILSSIATERSFQYATLSFFINSDLINYNADHRTHARTSNELALLLCVSDAGSARPISSSSRLLTHPPPPPHSWGSCVHALQSRLIVPTFVNRPLYFGW